MENKFQSLIDTTECSLCINGEVLITTWCKDHPDICEPVNIWIPCVCVCPEQRFIILGA